MAQSSDKQAARARAVREAKRAGKNGLALVRIALVTALFIPVVVFMMYVNYTVDRSGIYQCDAHQGQAVFARAVRAAKRAGAGARGLFVA